MELARLLQGVSVRAPWISAGRPILMSAGFAIHRGYDKTIEAAVKEGPDPSRQARLESLLVEHLIAGEKLVRLVMLEAGEREKLDAWAHAKRKASNSLTNAYPGVASSDDLVAYPDSTPSSLGHVELQTGSAALFTAVRGFQSRVELPVGALRSNGNSEYDKLIAIKRVFVQTYDAIWIPPKEEGNFICIATDYPRGVPLELAEASQTALQAQIRHQLGHPLRFANFWPAIDGLYSETTGKVVDYGFSVAGKSVNHHKARRSSVCLRKAVYDSAGAKAVGDDLQLFKLAVRWSIQRPNQPESEPEILLPGVAADLNKANANVNHFILRDSLNSLDLAFVVSKLLPHVS